MENIIISNENKFKELKERFKNGGPEKLHILADFDRTLTKVFVNGKKIPSLISVLGDENYLTPDYPTEANHLYEKYHAIEINPDIPIKEKRVAMEEWWKKHFDLLIKSDLNIKDIERAMKSANLVLRDGCVEFLSFLKEKGVPLVILSSAGLGRESIKLFLENKEALFDNIYIISNSFEWDRSGKALAVKQPIIHGMNKNEHIVNNFPKIFKKVKKRKNVILLGDNISDTEMISGFEYDNLIKIGFLNERIESDIENYKKKFDVIITRDSSMQFVLDLLKDLF